MHVAEFGDIGLTGSAELAWRPGKILPSALSGSELYGFVDGGKVWVKGRFGFPTNAYDLESAGGGVRLSVASKAVLQLEAARGLTNPVPFLERKDWRLIFTVRTLF